MIIAAKGGHLYMGQWIRAMVDLLIEAGANIEAREVGGSTPLN